MLLVHTRHPDRRTRKRQRRDQHNDGKQHARIAETKPNQNNAITTQIIGGIANKTVITGLSNAIAVLKLPATSPAANPAAKATEIPTTDRHSEIPISFS